MRKVSILSTISSVLFWTAVALWAVPIPPADKPTPPFKGYVAPASKEAERALKGIRIPKELQGSLWAAEPMLANPVCFCFDEKGRCFVAETFRMHRGVTDTRDHMEWLDDDLACRTVADRVAMYRKYLKDRFSTLETEHDRVRLLEDTKGAGVADKATVFADGFYHAEEGIGAGLLAYKGNVWFTCIPNVWLLRDTQGSGKANVKKPLSTGYGVHVAFFGHDLHGLCLGLDGRLYFSVGDRGLNVTTPEGKRLFNPDSGAVLRCDLDGSNLEVFATGLRNPQELAFDAFGNLFTVDNNSDSGDKARLVCIVEGGDSGWRIGYQYGSDLGSRGPFNAEKLWHLAHAGQPAYIVPPLAHIADGPSGLCYNPGAAALPARYASHFFLVDFRGNSGRSGVRSFAVKPKGAAFAITDEHEFIWSILATDCDFGPDGGFYVSDWTDGWGMTGKGRLYRFADPNVAKQPVVAEVKHWLAGGFDQRTTLELTKLLGHADMRVRREAQFALASKRNVTELASVARSDHRPLARLHGLWGLGQVGRQDPVAYDAVLSLTSDRDAEIRATAARVLGDGRVSTATAKLINLLADPEARVRFFAAQALGRIGSKECVKAAIQLLRDNADQDAYLRHAAVMALAGSGDQKALLAAAADRSASVRLGIVLALRRLEAAELAHFLDDPEPAVVLEAARAIHDLPVSAALPALAARLDLPNQPELLLYRALNVRFRRGRAEDAAAVAAFAARTGAPEELRVEAVRLLGAWGVPGRRDRVTGLTQDLGARAATAPMKALTSNLSGIFAGPVRVQQEVVRAIAALGIKDAAPELLKLAADRNRPLPNRLEALRTLRTLKALCLNEACQLALKDSDPLILTEGRRILMQLRPAEALAALAQVLRTGTIPEQQGAFAILEESGTEATALLAKSLDWLLKGELPPEVHLDLLQAAAKHSTNDVRQRLARYEAARPKNDPLALYREVLVGGNAEKGRHIFVTHTAASCVRCHKINGEGGEVGPDLSDIGAQQNREYLLESLVKPSQQIAKGFETVVVTLQNGKIVTGVFKSENAIELQLMTAEGQLIKVPKKQIDERQAGKSAMPEDLMKHLTKSELRDLMEYLAGLKRPKKQ